MQPAWVACAQSQPHLRFLDVIMYVCTYITAFASISSMALEIKALSFAVNRFGKKTKERSEHKYKVWSEKLKNWKKSRFV